VVGIDTNAMGRTQPMDLAIVADAGETLRATIDAVTSMVTKERLDKIREARLAMITSTVAERRENVLARARQNFDQAEISPDRLDYELSQAVDPHAIVVEENFTGRQNFHRYGYRPDEKLLLTKAGSLGWGVGAAAGAKIGAPDREVILNIGDGATMYSAAGFWTMARYEIPVLTVVWNNRNYQMVRNAYYRYNKTMVKAGQFHGAYLGDPDIDFAQVAGGQGVSGERVTAPSELAGAIQRGLQATRDGKPYLLDVSISRVGGGAESTWHHKYSVANEVTA
jgi:thiamine pyrophosphate-dependent acetolactate synthase large subunit-like protein